VAHSFNGWEGQLVLFQRESTKQTLDPYYECQEEHDADCQQRQEQIELLDSPGFCTRVIHDYLLVPVIKFAGPSFTSTSVCVDSSSPLSQWTYLNRDMDPNRNEPIAVHVANRDPYAFQTAATYNLLCVAGHFPPPATRG
jgi:hypothetical protein